jgi:diguanylate cyclase (GGDEF)-like protein/PAS domain S-box-containing protein
MTVMPKPGDEVLTARIRVLEETLASERAEWQERIKASEEMVRRVIHTTSEGFVMMDLDFTILEVNRALLQMLDLSPSDLIGRRLDALYDKGSVDFYFANREHLSFEAVFTGKNDRRLPVLVKRSAMQDDHGKTIGYLAFLTDLSELKTAQAELRKAEQRYRSMYENAVQGMFQSTVSGTILRANPAYARILGYDSVRQMLHLTRSLTHVFCSEDERKQLVAALGSRKTLANYEVKLRHKDGTRIWALINARLISDLHEEPIIEGILVDNTEIKLAGEKVRQSEEKFRSLAIHDNLTGLFNTRYLYQALDELVEKGRQTGEKFSLVFMDMDNFKQVVDNYGHLNGSQALAEVAGTIAACLVPPAFGVAYGGDEFIVVLPGFDKQETLAKAEEIRARMKQTSYLSAQGFDVRLAASFGVATFPDDAVNRTDLLALADQAMFRIKVHGKDAVGQL